MKLTFKLPSRRDPSSTLTGGELPGAPSRLQRAIMFARRYGPWALGGFFLFVLFVWMTLPTRAIAWRIGHEAKRAGYNVEVGDVSLSIFGGLTLEDVRWTFAPSRPGQIPQTLTFEEIEADIALLKLPFGIYDIDFEGNIEESVFEANWNSGAGDSSFFLEVAELPLYAVPKARQALNAPLSGMVALKVELTMPDGKFAETEGVLEIACAGCKVGDGETLLYVPGAKGLLAKGVTVPEIDLGSLSGRIVFEEGVGKTDGAIEAESDDVHVTIEGDIRLKDPFSKSEVNLVLKLQVAESLQQKSDSIRLLVQTAPPTQRLKEPESGLGFKLTGRVSRPRLRGINSKTRKERLRERRERAQKRAEQRAKRRREQERRRKQKENEPDPSDDTQEEEEEREDEPPRPTIGEPLQIEPLPSSVPTPSDGEGQEGDGEEPAQDGDDGEGQGQDGQDDGNNNASGGQSDDDQPGQDPGAGENEQPIIQ